MATFRWTSIDLTILESELSDVVKTRVGQSDDQMHDMEVVTEYVASIRNGYSIAREVVSVFELLFPHLDDIWTVELKREALGKRVDGYVVRLNDVLEQQRTLIASLTKWLLLLDVKVFKSDIKLDLKYVEIEISLLKIAAAIKSAIFRKDEVIEQCKLTKQALLRQTVKELNEEFKKLDERHTASILDLRDAIAKLSAALEFLPDIDLSKKVMQASIKAGSEIVKSFNNIKHLLSIHELLL
jgi:hypothetical protein